MMTATNNRSGLEENSIHGFDEGMKEGGWERGFKTVFSHTVHGQNLWGKGVPSRCGNPTGNNA